MKEVVVNHKVLGTLSFVAEAVHVSEGCLFINHADEVTTTVVPLREINCVEQRIGDRG